eukprot:TRINITY_DN24338_c0_g1_i1.p1 TRINITY_DN24338_c0_g1~~TRINITY_DN24338_c0_g1_i1.p1  ORF type:complete len:157 (-),score=35.97 TRINITY_DN24338_c0_g1_i1:33-503(-)
MCIRDRNPSIHKQMSTEAYLLSLISKRSPKRTAETTFINQKVSPFVKYFKDRVTVKFVGKGLLYTDVVSIQSNTRACHDSMIYYYELKINDIGNTRDLTVGYADKDFPQNKHPGHTKGSYGYRADGKVYTEKKAVKLDLISISCLLYTSPSPRDQA